MKEVTLRKVATPSFPLSSTSYIGFGCACTMLMPDGDVVEVVVIAGNREDAAVACELLSEIPMKLESILPVLVSKDPMPDGVDV